MSTYGPEVTFDLPSGSDAAEKVRQAAGVEVRETQQWRKNDEAPDDVRAAIGDALRAAYGGWIQPWKLLPREVEYSPSRVKVTLVPYEETYEAEDEQAVGTGPRQRLLQTLREYHEELGAKTVAERDLLAETPGDTSTLREELARLERQGEVYQPDENWYAATTYSGTV